MPSFKVTADALDPLPARFQGDLRAGIEREGGREPILGEAAEYRVVGTTDIGPVVPFTFTVDADDEKHAQAKAHNIIGSLLGNYAANIRIEPIT